MKRAGILLLFLPAVFALPGGSLTGESDPGERARSIERVTGALSSSWSASGSKPGGRFGASIAVAGDVNGDGYSDLLVGEPEDASIPPGTGRVHLYLGSPSGLESSPAWSGSGDQAGSGFGTSVATAGDVNGDGYHDILVGAPGDGRGGAGSGAVFLWLGGQPGGASGRSGLGADGVPSNADWIAWGAQSGEAFGFSVGTAGDVNGDGFADIVIGAPKYDGASGRAILWYGGPSSLSNASGLGANGDTTTADWEYWRGYPGENVGYAVSTSGDMNGDGFDDFGIGAPSIDEGISAAQGFVAIVLGSATGPDRWPFREIPGTGFFGSSLGVAGDFWGVGRSTLVAGATALTKAGTEEGRVYLIYITEGFDYVRWLHSEPTRAGAGVALSVSGAGDFNGDGRADVVVGWLTADPAAPALLVITTEPLRPYGFVLASISGEALGGNPGAMVTGAGDVDGDGYGDIAAGAPQAPGAAIAEGRAFAFRGGTHGPMVRNSAYDGGTAYSMSRAGDVNSDGFADYVTGAPGYHAVYYFNTGEARLVMGQKFPPLGGWALPIPLQQFQGFGASVSGAGDVNGDGYDDVIVGSPLFDTPFYFDAGRADVFHGSPNGMSAAWSAVGEGDAVLFGWSVAGAGDVNGDGFADVIVGAPLDYSNQHQEGKVRLYLGSPSGLSVTPAWIGEGDAIESYFGFAVAAAGDVNGDGRGDVIVGSPNFSREVESEGRVSLFLGTASGLRSAPAWTSEGNQPGAHLGLSVAGTGDVNGDGFGDVVAGAPDHDVALGDEGRVLLWYGDAQARRARPDPSGADWEELGVRKEQYLGISVTAAGDIDEDGFDEIIAAPGSFWFGGPLRPTTEPAVDIGGHDLVAGLGDLNGDGSPELGVARSDYHGVYFGNNGPGAGTIVRQERSDGTSPIASLGLAAPDGSFRIRAIGRTAAGRSKTRLQWEVKPHRTPFDGGDIQTSVDEIDPGAYPIEELVVQQGGLSPGGMYHWRARFSSNSPFFPRSSWRTPGHTHLLNADLRVPGCVDTDGDGLGAPAGEICSGGAALDNCESAYNPFQEDTDRDGHGDACDLCPAAYDRGQRDFDGDGRGDACEPTVLLPLDGAVTTCLAPPRISWLDGGTTKNKIVLSTSPDFKGRKFIIVVRAHSDVIPNFTKWIGLCGAADEYVYLKVQGKAAGSKGIASSQTVRICVSPTCS